MDTAHKRRGQRTSYLPFSNFPFPKTPAVLPFRRMVKIFLENCAVQKDYYVNSSPVWEIEMIENGHIISLFVIEEAGRPPCIECMSSAWSRHYISRTRYHFLIPRDEMKSFQDATEAEVFQNSSHRLHGLVHGNGCGHLLMINGLEGGSKFLRGEEIMDFWDAVCTSLHCRKISVMDTSMKKGMKLRLVEGVAYSRSWFERWGYKDESELKLDYYIGLNILNTLKVQEVYLDSEIQKYTDARPCTIGELFVLMLKKLEPAAQGDARKKRKGPHSEKQQMAMPRAEIYSAIRNLLDKLQSFEGSHLVKDALSKLSDVRTFIKSWEVLYESEQLLTYVCRLRRGDRCCQLGELVVVTANSTLRNMKMDFCESLKETYTIREIDNTKLELEGGVALGDGDILFGRIQSGSEIYFRVAEAEVLFEDIMIYEGEYEYPSLGNSEDSTAERGVSGNNEDENAEGDLGSTAAGNETDPE